MYSQLIGTAIGTKNGAFLCQHLHTQTRRILVIEINNIWLRYTDDILCLWEGSKEELETVLEELNTFHQKIKFTWEISNTQAIFLVCVCVCVCVCVWNDAHNVSVHAEVLSFGKCSAEVSGFGRWSSTSQK